MQLEELARRRRLARMRLLAERGERRRQEARALRQRGGASEARGRRRRERRGLERQRKREGVGVATWPTHGPLSLRELRAAGCQAAEVCAVRTCTGGELCEAGFGEKP